MVHQVLEEYNSFPTVGPVSQAFPPNHVKEAPPPFLAPANESPALRHDSVATSSLFTSWVWFHWVRFLSLICYMNFVRSSLYVWICRQAVVVLAGLSGQSKRPGTPWKGIIPLDGRFWG